MSFKKELLVAQENIDLAKQHPLILKKFVKERHLNRDLVIEIMAGLLRERPNLSDSELEQMLESAVCLQDFDFLPAIVGQIQQLISFLLNPPKHK